MKRKIFYTIIGIGLLILFVYTLLSISIFKNLSFPTYRTGKIKDLFALGIIIYETFQAKKPFQKINFILLLVAMLAYFMRIMHWPFANLLYFGSLLATCILLFCSMVKINNPLMKILILIYPLSRIALSDPFFDRSSVAWWTIEIFIPGIFAIFLLLLRKKI